MNASSVDAIILEISNEIKDERYENVKSLVEKTYSEIIKVQSENTALNVIYSNTTRSLKLFVINNWKILSSLAIVIIVFLLIYRIKISIWLVNRKMEALKLRKKTIKELVMQTQKDYFQYGKMPEGEYNIKTKKFAELVRDIDRQIPLLQEQLAKLEKE
jgi:beta-lactamase regulating signal transducer with metallopeptidase domain